MAKLVLLPVLCLLGIALGDDSSSVKSISETVSTTITVDWLFTPPGQASPTPEPNPFTIISTIPYATYNPISRSSMSSAPHYPVPGESSEPQAGTASASPSDSCNYYTVTTATVTPTTLVTTKAITITTMTTEAYSTIGAASASLSSSRQCNGKHDPNCANDHWGGLTASHPLHETGPFTIVTSWKRDVKTLDENEVVTPGTIITDENSEESNGRKLQAWGLGIFVAGLVALF